MIGSFYVGYTGLTANNKYLNIISDNIANVNTVGFKAELPVFEDILQSAITSFTKNGTPINFEMGGGEVLASTIKNFSQGIFMQTGNSTDLAIDGKGLFILTDGETTFYSRNGEFRLDPEGNLINPQGLRVLGWKLDKEGNMIGALQPINIPLSMNPNQTSEIRINEPSNLDASSPILMDTESKKLIKFNPADNEVYSRVESITIYDSLGNSHLLEFYFEHIGENKWYTYLMLDGKEIEFKKIDSNGNNHYLGGLMLEFDNEGKLANIYYSGLVAADSNNNPIKIDLSGKTDTTASFEVSKIDTNYNINAHTNSTIHVKADYKTDTLIFYDSNYSSSELSESPYILEPGTIKIKIKDLTLVDDGHGNLFKLVDSNNWIVDKTVEFGTVDYSKGIMKFIRTNLDSTSTEIEFKLLKVRDSNGRELYGKIQETRTVSLDKDWMLPFDPKTGANKLQLNFDFSKITQLASTYMFFGYQDGNSKGDLMNISVGEDGSIRGSYTNGLTIPIARLAIALFKDTEMLRRAGSALYLPSSPTYTPIIVPGGVISRIRSQMLEASNVDLAQEFINLMVAQRAYQANARVISTSDQVLTELINLKR